MSRFFRKRRGEAVLSPDGSTICRRRELGCEVKNMGRGHSKRIKNSITKMLAPERGWNRDTHFCYFRLQYGIHRSEDPIRQIQSGN